MDRTNMTPQDRYPYSRAACKSLARVLRWGSLTCFLAEGGDLALGLLPGISVGDRFSRYSAMDSSSESRVTRVEYFCALGSWKRDPLLLSVTVDVERIEETIFRMSQRKNGKRKGAQERNDYSQNLRIKQKCCAKGVFQVIVICCQNTKAPFHGCHTWSFLFLSRARIRCRFFHRGFLQESVAAFTESHRVILVTRAQTVHRCALSKHRATLQRCQFRIIAQVRTEGLLHCRFLAGRLNC